MIYTDTKLFELLEERRDLKVSFDDEYSFSDEPAADTGCCSAIP